MTRLRTTGADWSRLNVSCSPHAARYCGPVAYQTTRRALRTQLQQVPAAGGLSAPRRKVPLNKPGTVPATLFTQNLAWQKDGDTYKAVRAQSVFLMLLLPFSSRSGSAWARVLTVHLVMASAEVGKAQHEQRHTAVKAAHTAGSWAGLAFSLLELEHHHAINVAYRRKSKGEDAAVSSPAIAPGLSLSGGRWQQQ